MLGSQVYLICVQQLLILRICLRMDQSCEAKEDRIYEFLLLIVDIAHAGIAWC